MASSTCAGVVCVILIFCCVVPSLATSYTVGDTTGWTTNVDYTSWTSGKTLSVGDSLVFNYGSGHTVDEVSSSDYTTCTVGNAITSDSSGATTVTLKTAGTHYFICGVIGHCGSGMKVAVTVGAGAATTTPSGTPSTGTTSPSPPAVANNNPTITTPSSTVPRSSSGTLSPFVAVLITWVALLKLVLS